MENKKRVVETINCFEDYARQYYPQRAAEDRRETDDAYDFGLMLAAESLKRLKIQRDKSHKPNRG